MPFASINSTNPRTNPWKSHKKYWELAELENEFFFESAILNFKMADSKIFLLHLKKNKQAVHMIYHLFLKYVWFPQNLWKDIIRTNMHTTVPLKMVLQLKVKFL